MKIQLKFPWGKGRYSTFFLKTKSLASDKLISMIEINGTVEPHLISRLSKYKFRNELNFLYRKQLSYLVIIL